MPERILEPKEFDPADFGLPEDARGLAARLDLSTIESHLGYRRARSLAI